MNDFNTFKIANILSNEFDEEVGRSLKKTMSNNTEYLSPKCLPMTLTDPYLDLETKIKLLNALIAYEVPELTEISITAPDKVVITENTNLESLITQENWTMFILLGIEKEVQEWYKAAVK